MAIRRKRKNVSKKSPAHARRQKIERRRLLLENLEDRRLLAGIPELAGIQVPGELDQLKDGDILDVAPRELVFGFNQAAEIDPETLGAIQVLQSGKDGTFNRATTSSDLNTGDVEVLFTATRAGEAGNGTSVVFTKSNHGNASGAFVEVDADNSTVTIDLNTHPSNSTTAQGIVNAINGDTDASSLLTAEIVSGNALADVAAVEITYSPITLAGSNDVVMEPGYVGIGDSAREVVFRFKETLADETYQVVIDGSSPLAMKDLDGSIFQDGENVTLQFELELGAQVEAVVPQPIIRDSVTNELNQLLDTIHVYFNDDDLNEEVAEDPEFYELIYTQKTVDAEDDLVFSPATVDYDAQADFAVLTFSHSLIDLPDPDTGQPIGPGIFRLRIGTAEDRLVTPLHVDLSSGDAGSSFESAQSVGTNLVVQDGGDDFVDGQSFDIEDDQGVPRTFEFDTNGSTLAAGATAVPVAVSDTPSEVAASIAAAINGAGFDVQATRDGERITLVNAQSVEHADLVISGDASTFLDGQSVQVVSDSGRIDVLEVETGFLLAVPAAGSDPATEITDTQTFTVSDGSTTVTFEFDLQGNGVATGNVAIGYAGGEDATDMAEKVVQAINGQSLGLTSQALGAGGIHLGGTTDHTLDTDSTAMNQSGQPGVGQGNVAVPVVPSAAVTGDQVASGIVDAVNAAGLVGVSARLDGTRIFLDGVSSVTSAGGVGGALLSAPVSVEQFSSIILKGEIEPQTHLYPETGSVEEPGHRDIRVQSHLNAPVDSVQGINNSESTSAVQYYSFPDQYGADPQGNILLNAITEEQKQRAREIFEIFGQQLGITFVEHDAPNDGENDLGFKIVTGDMRALDPTLVIGVGGRQGYSGDNLAIMDLQDFQQADDDRYGGPWFQTAMHEIGHLLGLGHTDELPEITVMNDDDLLTPVGQTAEPIYPGDHDLVHGRQLYRPDSKDIDLYRVPIDKTGTLRIETFAERQLESSTLDSVVALYREYVVDGEKVRELVARNDDYFSEDSRIELSLQSGTYYIGVSASGNGDYDPAVDDSGYGGKSQGLYELQLTFRPDADKSITDEAGVALDGDGDGESGGVFNFWFQTAVPSGVASNPDDPQTFYVDKLATGAGNGSQVNPFGNVQDALAAASQGDIVRLVGNPGADGDLSTQSDNVAYQFGYDRINGLELEDGSALLVPQGVTVMVDAGAIIKSRRGRIGVGSSSPSIDRSGGALQVLGTPHLVDQAGNLLLDGNGDPVPGSVYLTSINDLDLGLDSNPDSVPPEPRPGDWGGIDFRQDIDSVREAPALYADKGIFLDYVNHAEITYGGGVVLVDGTSEVISPIHLTDARPTLTYNTITESAESAISANPDSFKETTFHERSKFQSGGINFTSDYSRVGPDIHGNTVVNNSINGLFVRTATPAGNELESLTVAGRFDDNDIVHVITENLKIQGTPGGPLLEVTTPSTTLVTLESGGNGNLAPGSYNYRIVFVDADGNEENPSEATRTHDHTSGSILLDKLPPVTSGFTSRRLYRSDSSGNGPYRRVAELNASSFTYEDTGLDPLGAVLDTTITDPVGSRLDASLVIDPAVIVKLDGAHIEAGIGAQLLAEGKDGREIIFTSIRDPRHGTGGTFDTSNQGDDTSALCESLDPAEAVSDETDYAALHCLVGDWSGIVARPMSHLSIDNSEISFGGGVGRIEGAFVGFNAVEIHQAEARIANSVFQYNADGTGGVGAQQDPDRIGRGPNDQAVIFVRGAQPVIINNVIRGNLGQEDVEKAAAISIDVNSLSHVITTDPGRSTGQVDRVTHRDGNQGALVHGNALDKNAINGMVVRGGTLTTEGVWDDTDIVHVLQDLVHITDFHTAGGLRLQSSGSESLVVKLLGTEEFDNTGALVAEGAGFRADGRPLEIDDRIGGKLHIVGQPRHPVVITSLADDTVAAGYTPDGFPQFDTNNDGLVAQPTGDETNVEFTINTDATSSDPTLRQALDEAGFLWGSVLQDADENGDAVELVFDVVVGPLNGPIGVMNSTQTFGQVEYDDVRDAMIADASDSERPLVERLPELADLQTVGGTATGFINITRANAKALGMDLDSITWNFPATCFTVDCDGIFTISDGLPLDTFAPLTSLVLHEVGHALGFVSSLGRDLDEDDLSTLDMFRLEPGQGDVDFTNAPRVVAQAIDSVFYDGKYDSSVHTAPGGLTVGDIPMSTGDPDPPGDGNQPSHYKNANLNGGVIIGVMDPTIQGSTIDDPISDADLSVLGLIGWDVTDATVPPPLPGDWGSIELSTFSHDRNIGVVVEREIGKQNEKPETAQVLGALAPDEKAGDDNQRLGFQVHGQISDPGDVDVYSFEARGGTEVWLDIDASSYILDTVVELVDVNGDVLFRSDNSIEEAADPTLLDSYRDITEFKQNEEDGVFPLEKSSHEIPDHWSTNPRDAGMRIVLPGEADTVNNYHVRVSSNNTGGRYELQVRLRELDEPAGSTIQYADIRYATNAIEIVGQTVHSPLLGEIREVSELAGDPALDTAADALQMGNLLETDRAALSIAGHMRDDSDVDFFEFEVNYEHVSPFALQDYPQYPYSVVFDVDYADGLARANTSLEVFAGGTLILTGQDSNVAEDRPGPLRGIDMEDLSRGSVGGLDPLLGTVELPGGTTYQVAVSTESLVPEEMDQFINAIPVNPGLRLEPVPAVGRIVEDHIAETFFSTQQPPQVPVLVGDDGIVPYHIGDVVLFVSQDSGLDQTTVSTIDGFTGAVETTVGSFNRDVGDIDIRGVDNRMYAFTLDLEDGASTDGQAGNYIQIDTGDATLINPCDGTLQDDGVLTNHEDPANPGNSAASDVGMHYDALTYAGAGLLNQVENGFVVGHRPENAPTNPLVTGGTSNILYRFDPQCGGASSSPQLDRTGAGLIAGAGTNIVERGILDTKVDSNGSGFGEIIASEATEVASDGTTITRIADGTRFLVEHDGNLLTPAVEFEFNGGPEVYFTVDPANGIFVRDGDGFNLDGQPYEFNTGAVLVVNAQSGSQVIDGEVISITDKNGQLKNFEFDSGNGVGPGSESIAFTNSMSQPQLVTAVMNAINGAANFEVQASTLSATSNRITLVDDSTTSSPSTTAANIEIQGAGGGAGGAGALIEIEETFSHSQFSDAIVTRFNQLPAITVSADGDRINFSGSLFGSFTEIINRGVFTDQQTDGLFGVTAVQIPFLASDTAEEIAEKMTTALNGQTIPTTQDGTVVRLDAPATVVPPIDSPLRIGGRAPGGDIAGMAFIGNTLYAVSDQSFDLGDPTTPDDDDLGGGGLFVVNNPLGILQSASLDYVNTSAPFLQGIDFQGLAAGPVATEDGLYQDILFGIDSAGELYAFNTDGVLQPLFVDGATSVQTGLANVTGLQFSTREENLWAITSDRDTDPGHGVLPSYDGVRATVTPGNNSLHFGQGIGNNIDLPGGVHGSFETRTFSLENYSAADQPVLYFNYFAETEGATSAGIAGDTMRDSIRIFVGDDSGEWDLLTTNNSDPAVDRELDLEPAKVQEAFDGVNQWRQVRADLSSYAGHANLRLRFDFSTAGEMNTGHQHTVGEELRTIPARDLRDGQVITIGNAGPDGRWGLAGVDDDNNDIVDDASERQSLGSDDLSNLETFEIDLGYTLVAPSGAGITDGDHFTVDYGSGIVADFEFDSNGSSSAANTIPFEATMSAAEIARAMQTAILAGVQAPVQNGTINGTSEPNDDLANAIPINLNGLSGRFIASGGEIGDNPNLVTLPDADVDLLSIDLATDTRITVDIDSEDYSNNVELLNSFVRIFDSSGQVLASNNAASAPGEQPGTDSYLEFSAPLDGTYYIGISGAGNTTYDPNLVESGVEGSTGSYDVEIQVQTSGGYVQRSNHRVQLPGAVDVTETSGLTIDGQPGVSGDFAITLHGGMNQDAVADAVRRSLAGAYAGDNLDVIKGHDQVVRVIGHSVVDAGPFGLTFQMPGDVFGDFNSNERGQNNTVEGVYIDDIIVGFAERGEMVTGAGVNTNFIQNPRPEPNQITEGPYQLEIRNSTSYIDVDPSLDARLPEGTVRTPFLTTTLDTNARLSEQTTLIAPEGYDIADGQSFTLFDGLHSLVFEYDEDSLGEGVGQGVVEISFDPDDSSAVIAQRIRDAVNSDAVQSILDIRAASSDGTVVGNSGDNRVDLFGNVSHLPGGQNVLVDQKMEVIDVTTDGNLLRDTLVGSGITPIGEATRVGGDFSSGIFRGGLSTIGFDGGIVLSTGNVKNSEGPNAADGASGSASGLGDASLDAEFITSTVDSSSLEFQLETDTGDIFFDFVFASEEYNERVGDPLNDVFAIFVNGINIALVPGTDEPVSSNAVNGGNPLGTGANNPQYFVNNDLDDGGQFLTELGYDGFTSVLSGEALGLGTGTHTIKVALADRGADALDSAVFMGADSLRAERGTSTRSTRIAGEQFDLIGDQNRHREQGQVLIHSNRIFESEGFGIIVDSSADPQLHGGVPTDNNLHQGPTRSLLELNTAKLVQGVTITNNVLASNGEGGILFQGDVSPIAAVPFGRIVNNTIVGDLSGFPSNDVGITVVDNAGPTILNNIVANLETGISIDASSGANTVLGGTLYAGNTVQFATPPEILGGDFPIILADEDANRNGRLDPGEDLNQNDVLDVEPLFVKRDFNNFYPAANSKAIDSSINSLEERASLNTVKAPLGIAPSPILAPELDGVGQERVDDPDVATPSGLGQNVFKDRGAIDRSDFSGPSAIMVVPEDLVYSGENTDPDVDKDGRASFVEIRRLSTEIFEILLVDGVVPIDPGDGIGIDDSTVKKDAIKLFQDDERLEEGLDYLFSYNSTNDVIRLTALAGAFQQDRTYRVELANVGGFVIEPEDGSLVNDGDTFQVSDQDGLTVEFEYDSGSVIQVQQGYTLAVPENGGADISDGETFVISDDVGNDYTFELDRNGVIEQGNFAVPYTITSSADTVATSIVTSLTDAEIGLSPVKLAADEDGNARVHVGTGEIHVLDTSSTTIDQAGVPASATDGDLLAVDNGSTVVTFEFDSDGTVALSGSGIAFTPATTHEELADAISTAISNASLGLSATHYGNGLVHLVGTGATQLDTTDSSLLIVGEPGVRPGFGVQIPSQAGAPDGLVDGETFTIDGGGKTITVEFDDDQDAIAGNVVVRFDDTSTIDGVANELVSVLQVAVADGKIDGLEPTNAGNGLVELGGDGSHVLDLDQSVLAQVGTPGLDAAVAVPFIPDESFDKGDMSQSIATAINGSDLEGVTAQARIDSVVVRGAGTIDSAAGNNVSGILDLAGNPLQPNQVDEDTNGNGTLDPGEDLNENGELDDGSSTVLTIVLSSGLDYGDAPDPPYASTRDNNGATHVVVDGYHLGAGVDVETDARSNSDATGDTDDGVVFNTGLAAGFETQVTVTASGVTADRAGALDAWIDFDHDGDWSLGERVISQSLTAGDNQITFSVPTTALIGSTVARFRFSSVGTPSPDGPAIDGEVEDYQVTIGGNPWRNNSRPLDVNNDTHVSPIDALQIITALNDGKAGLLPVPPTVDFSPPPFLDVNGDGHLSPLDALLVIDELNSQSSGEGEGEGEGEPAGLAAPLASTLTSEHLVMAEASFIPRLSDFIPRRQSSLVMPASNAPADARMDSRRAAPSLSAAAQPLAGASSDELDDVLQLIGEDLSDVRESDAHDEYFARLRF